MEDDAVSKAGQYCHAKGQKLVIVPTKDKDVTFQCGEKIQVPDTATPVTQEPATAAPVQLKPPDGAAQATRPEAALPREELRQDMQRDRA
jgi:hypothetical protein